MNGQINYSFSGIIWQHLAPNGWFFVSLPIEISTEIREHLKWQEEGWGRMKAIARIGNTEWETAIWFDTKVKTYILPLKGAVRKQENLTKGESVDVSLLI